MGDWTIINKGTERIRVLASQISKVFFLESDFSFQSFEAIVANESMVSRCIKYQVFFS